VLLAVIGCGLGWVASAANAQAVVLDWSAPAGCPDARAMRASVARLLALSQASGTGVRATGEVKRQGARWVLRLSMTVGGQPATRTLSATDCASLSETAAWLVAIAVDPELPQSAAEPPTTQDSSTPASSNSTSSNPDSSNPDSSKPDSSKPASDARDEQAAGEASNDAAEHDSDAAAGDGPPATWRVGIFGGAFAAGLAGFSPSIGARLSLEVSALSTELSLAHHFERSLVLSTPAGAESHFSGQELALAGCYAWGSELRVGPCVVLSAARVQGGVTGITHEQDRVALIATLGPSLGVSYRGFSPLELFVDAGVWALLTRRPEFEVEGLGPVGEASSLGGRARLGVGMRLP
jgi:hypothetical protein